MHPSLSDLKLDVYVFFVDWFFFGLNECCAVFARAKFEHLCLACDQQKNWKFVLLSTLNVGCAKIST